MAKLTLHVPDELVVAAKSEAASRQVSVSKLVSDFFRCLAANELGDDRLMTELKLAPKTLKLAGCIPDADSNDYLDYLDQKHS